MPERWTRGVLRRRTLVLAGWLAVLVVGAFASVDLPGRLATSFAVPGTESEQARTILAHHFGERPDGVFTVVFRTKARDAATRRRLRAELATAAKVVPTGHVQGALRSGGGIVYGDIATTLDLQHAKAWTEPLRRALAAAGGPPAYVTGQPAIQHDLEPVLSSDLGLGEEIALPLALAVLLVVLGLSAAVLVPFVFAACTIAGTLAAVDALTHAWTTASYVQNLVELIGLGLAVDYSLLVVSRFREELARHADIDEAVVATMATAGRAVVFSGLTVAIGLALLLAVPVPFIRSLGAGAALVPLVSVAAATTLQPALLSLLGRRGARRLPVAALLRARLGLRLPVLPGTRRRRPRLLGAARAGDHAPPGRLPRARRDPARCRGLARGRAAADARLDLRAAAGQRLRHRARAPPERRRRRRAHPHRDRRRLGPPGRRADAGRPRRHLASRRRRLPRPRGVRDRERPQGALRRPERPVRARLRRRDGTSTASRPAGRSWRGCGTR